MSLIAKCILLLPLLAFFASPACAAEPTAWRLDRILTTFWSAPPADDAHLEKLKSENFNLTWCNESALPTVHKHGLKAILLEQAILNLNSLDNPANKAKLDALIARVKDNPALEAYFVLDEPTGAQLPAVAKIVSYLRQKDPKHLAYVNLYPCYVNAEKLGAPWYSLTGYDQYLSKYITLVKPQLLSYDHYHFYNKSDSTTYFYNLATISRAADKANIPFINIIQAARMTQRWRRLNGNELRWMVYTTLAYGGKGVGYFLYWGPTAYGGIYQDGKPTQVVAPITRINAEVLKLSPELINLKHVATYQTDPVPWGALRLSSKSNLQIRGGGQFVVGEFSSNTFLLVNRNYSHAQTARIHVPSHTQLREFDKAQGKWKQQSLKAADCSITLAPGDGVLLRAE